MDPITLTILLTLSLASGGFALYKINPQLFAKIPGLGKLVGPRSITLDASMPDADKQTVIAAIMTSTSAAPLTALAQQYSAYPWAVFELNYRAWELGGQQGPAPTPPATGGVSVPETMPAQPAAPAQPAQPQTPSATPVSINAAALAAQAAAVAQQSLAALQQQLQHPVQARPSGPTTLTAPPSVAPVGGPNVVPERAEQAGAQGGYATAATMPSAGARSDLIDHVSGAPAAEPAPPPAGPFRRFQPSMEALRDAGLTPEADEMTAGSNPTPAAVVHAATGTRPSGTPFLRIRDIDKLYPRTIATIGTGSQRAGLPAMKHLVDLNPHLAPTGIIPQLKPGDEVNVPESWAAPLRAKGFSVFGADGQALS